MDVFKTGKVAMLITENWAVPSVVEVLGEKVGFTTPPGYEYAPGKVRRAYYAGGAFPYCINKFSKNKDAAWEFIKWASSIKVAKKMTEIGGATNYHSTVFDDLELATKYPWLPVVKKVAENHFSRPLIPEYPQYEEIVGIALSEAAIGKLSVETALRESAMKMYEILKRAGYYK